MSDEQLLNNLVGEPIDRHTRSSGGAVVLDAGVRGSLPAWCGTSHRGNPGSNLTRF
jgi:hypothetical protein